MKSRPTDDHHWLALWLTLAGGAFVSLGPQSTLAGVMLGAGFVWLVLVE